jgi:hypothetical protein
VKVGFIDGHFVRTPGGGGTAEVVDDVIYLTMSVRNAAHGVAILQGWRFQPEVMSRLGERPPVEAFRRLTRDLYLPAGDVGFWQGAMRDRADPEWEDLRDRITTRERLIIDLLYSDHQGGQRVISRFTLIPRDDGSWLAAVTRHWNVDRPDPR